MNVQARNNMALLGLALTDALTPRRERFFVVARTQGTVPTADVFDRETKRTWRCHQHQLPELLSGEIEPSQDWLCLMEDDEEDE